MAIQIGFNWLIEQQLLLSLLFAGFVLLERFGLKTLGSRFVYKLAWLIPVSVLLANLPSAIKPLQNSGISYYLITPNQVLTNSLSVSLALLYVIITTVLLIAAVVTHTRFVKGLKFTELANFKQVIIGVKTYTSAQVATPMVIGVFNSKLVLPHNYNTQFDNATLALILEHENVHIKRKDNLINVVLLLATILLWFNPLAWMAYASCRRLQELTCDERVLSNKTTQQQILYSKALINCAANAPAGLMAYSHYGDKKTMLQRLTNIKHNGAHSRLAKGSVLLIAASLLSGLAVAKQPEASAKKETSIAPVMRIEPLYPKQAAEQGISGSVVLKYDITPAGKTANITVVKAEPEAVFNKEAKRALMQWQYTPSSMGQQNVLIQLDFELNSTVTKSDLIERVNISH
ncbi:energy transducer TonB [Pseudoalteromonas sp. S3260]|uniref:M56 family metallopeptidase n=1 Tax=Pseudoalteromonas sp. S3260 TaxID=579534 RepID=UPI00110B0DC2|nr:M56 family metallopeptidase [Pseudoalteromonas sp. S3260]TMO95371.1 energy transducer TonB [Pseudoalteromonas sp. S3260]